MAFLGQNYYSLNPYFMDLNKKRIKQRFAGAAETYDAQAVIQHKVADRLLAMLAQKITLQPERILEIGCCTGLLTQRLAKRFSNIKTLYVNDLVPEFGPIVIKRLDGNFDVKFIAGDIEKTVLPNNLDLVISSSTFHWLGDLSTLFTKLAAHMAPEGTLAFSIYGRDNLLELKDITGIGLKYFGFEDLQEQLGEHFDIVSLREEHITLDFKEPLDVLYHLRETGVNSLDSTVWNKSRLKDFCKRYRARFAGQDSLKLTYHPMYYIARKRPS